jgi:response regulator RpfG family c-di-GMP phosphodiesterase
LTTLQLNRTQMNPSNPVNESVKARVLIVDDDQLIRMFVGTRLRAAGYLVDEASDAQQAILSLSNQPFDLVLSDIRMPGRSGIELLHEISTQFPDVGVVMLTACDEVSLAVQAMQMGAIDYMVKSTPSSEIPARIHKALERQQNKLMHHQHIRQIEATIQEQTLELQEAFAHLEDASEAALDALVTALDAREHETQAHSKRVGEYAVHLARVTGMDEKSLTDIGQGAMLHDIGKIGVPDSILLKPGKLSDDKWVQMRKHPQIGYWILKGIAGLRGAAEIVLSHHERYDGSGYPLGLKGEEIPLGARIFSVVDCLDAMISDRPYRAATSYESAREEIIQCSGTQFDPVVVKFFLQVPKEQWQQIRLQTLTSASQTF